jgi:hypothetical protein
MRELEIGRCPDPRTKRLAGEGNMQVDSFMERGAIMSDLNVAESGRHSNRVTFYAFLLETKRSCRTQRMEKKAQVITYTSQLLPCKGD